MSLWMVRAGRHGEFEDRFLDESRIYLTWDAIGANLCHAESRAEIAQPLEAAWPNAAIGKIRNHAGQIWAYVKEMKPGDVVVVPSKKNPEFHFDEVASDCAFNESESPRYRRSLRHSP